MKYWVWDPDNEEETDAKVRCACDSEAAAKSYAEDDRDGLTDGIYEGSGHLIMVKDEEGRRWGIEVRVEYEPTYYAHEVWTHHSRHHPHGSR